MFPGVLKLILFSIYCSQEVGQGVQVGLPKRARRRDLNAPQQALVMPGKQVDLRVLASSIARTLSSRGPNEQAVKKLHLRTGQGQSVHCI